ncbi:alpha/beta fold hydrolase [Nonomuraea sp. B10E15]|uniref:alpha/beta fold hydrolase n=1 Tax=Nonomuraea sp. B10E15 TaxID=3153560 RepID=UPI00325ED3EC
MRTRSLIAAGMAIALTLPLTAAVAAAAATAWALRQPPVLVWKDCGDGLSCADMVVPVDWADPDGPTTSVHLAKLPARDPARRVGPLVVNLGGPASTAAGLRFRDDPHFNPERAALLRELSQTFDVIAIDPRGLAESASSRSPSVSCPEPAPPVTGLVTARTKRDWDAHAAKMKMHYASCRKMAGPVWHGLTSWQVAHDLDALRAALGQRTLRYAGNSYGTVFGQAYLELFPRRVGRMYLDSIGDHTSADLEPWLVNAARAQERQLTRFRDWCADRRDCALHGHDAGEVFDALLSRARRAPLPAANGSPIVTEGQLLASAIFGLNPGKWPEFATALRKARDGNAADFLTVLAPPKGDLDVSDVMHCNDLMPEPPTYQRFQAIEARLRAIAPRFGWIEGRYQVGWCWGRPTSGGPSWAPHPLRVAANVPPVLVAIGELDNNTNPLGQAHVAAQIPGARVLWHGDGHFAWRDNACVRRHANAYLATGVLPPRGKRCPAEKIHRVGK